MDNSGLERVENRIRRGRERWEGEGIRERKAEIG